MEGLCEQLKLNFFWEQRGIYEKTYHTASDHTSTANVEIGRLTRYCIDAVDLGLLGLVDVSSDKFCERLSYVCRKLQQARGRHMRMLLVQLMGINDIVLLVVESQRVKLLEVFVYLPDGLRWLRMSIHGSGHIARVYL